MAEEPISSRVRVRRLPELGQYEQAAIEAALDRGMMAHVAFADGDQPYCIPMLYARSGPVVYIHGSTGSRAERLAAFEAFTEKLLPGRWAEARTPNRKELNATIILALPIGEASVKVSSGGPDDDDSPDAELDVWAGEVPLRTFYGPPEPSPGLRGGIPVPDSVTRLTGGQAGDSAGGAGAGEPLR